MHLSALDPVLTSPSMWSPYFINSAWQKKFWIQFWHLQWWVLAPLSKLHCPVSSVGVVSLFKVNEICIWGSLQAGIFAFKSRSHQSPLLPFQYILTQRWHDSSHDFQNKSISQVFLSSQTCTVAGPDSTNGVCLVLLIRVLIWLPKLYIRAASPRARAPSNHSNRWDYSPEHHLWAWAHIL